MTSLLLLLLALAPPPPTEATLARGETLEQLASRTLGDMRAASELRALNALGPGAPVEGAVLRLPGPERTRSRSALNAAWTSVRQREGAIRVQAEKTLAEAESLFASARYDEAAARADEAWSAVSAESAGAQRFAVAVERDGGVTEVTNHAGAAVRVEAKGTVRAVQAGHTVRVERGQPPPAAAPLAPPPAPLGIPTLLSPAPREVLRQRPVGRGLEPVTVRWTAVEGADGYVVQVLDRRNRRSTVRTTRHVAQLPSLPPGSYRWSVRAVLGGREGEASAPLRFSVEEESLPLEVKGSGWK